MTLRFANLLHFVLACGVLASIGCGNASDESEVPAETAPNGEMAAPEAAAPSEVTKVNLNTASEQDFLAIPNVGERMAHEFDEYRPYVSIQQFRREIGKYVDEDQVAAYEEYVFVPVSPNESDEETLMQLPGVNAGAASELAAARPYASEDAFLEKLREYVSESEAARARSYLTSP